jgi:hypothetical protein
MPVILRWNGYRFFFYSNEGIPPEPLHIHIRKGEATAKFWIEPEVKAASSYGMSASELNMLRQLVEENADLIREKWNEFFKN